MATILHLAPAEAWLALPPDATTYAPSSLTEEGFVHATAGDEVLLQVANAFYRDQPGDFVVLSLDEARLGPEVRWEAPEPAPPPGSEVPLFPHVYGPLDLAAVTEVRSVARDADGGFVEIVAYRATT